MLLSNLNLLATAPDGVAKLRELILTLAVQGKLVPQDPKDEPASVLLTKIRAEKDRLIAEGKIKRDKPVAEIAEEAKPFELPDGWEWTRIGDIAQANTGFAFKSGEYTTEGTLVFRVTNIRPDGTVDLSDTKFINSAAASTTYKNFLLNADDVLLVMVGGSLGKIGIVEEHCLPAVLNQNMWKMANNGAVERRFFVDCLRYVNAHQIKITNSTHGHLAQGEYLQQPIALPPLAEQSRIVTRVEELMRLCDALQAKARLEATQYAQLVATLLSTLTDSTTPEELTENWHCVATHFDLLLDRPEAVDALEQTILQLAVRGLLVPQDPRDEPASILLQKIRAEKDRLIAQGKIKRDKPLPPIAEDEKPFELPLGWEWVSVGDVVEMLNGYAFKSEWFKTKGTRLLRNLNVGHGCVDWSAPAFIDNALAREYEQFALHEGDVVLTLDRPIISTGLKLAVLREQDLPCLLLQRVARLSPDAQALSQEFLVLWMQSDAFVGTLDAGRSNGVPHISTKQVASMAFPLPPLAEQSRIVARVASLRALCADLRQRLTTARAQQALLAQVLVENVA